MPGCRVVEGWWFLGGNGWMGVYADLPGGIHSTVQGRSVGAILIVSARQTAPSGCLSLF